MLSRCIIFSREILAVGMLVLQSYVLVVGVIFKFNRNNTTVTEFRDFRVRASTNPLDAWTDLTVVEGETRALSSLKRGNAARIDALIDGERLISWIQYLIPSVIALVLAVFLGLAAGHLIRPD